MGACGNDECRASAARGGGRSFGIRHWCLIRHSDFAIRHCQGEVIGRHPEACHA
jgi:hypothetical protein